MNKSSPKPDQSVVLDAQRVSKKFVNSRILSLVYGPADWLVKLISPSASPRLRRSESWGIQDATFQLRKGETIGIIGSIGAGKSTLARALAGELHVSYGKVDCTLDILSKSWEVESIRAKSLQFNNRKDIISCLLTQLESGIGEKVGKGANSCELERIFNGEISSAMGPADMTASRLSLVAYKYVLEYFSGLLVLDDFMADMESSDRAQMAKQWKMISHASVARVLVFENTAYVRPFCDRLLVIQNQKVVHDGDVDEGLEKFDAIFRSRPDEARKYFPEISTNLDMENRDAIQVCNAGFLRDGQTAKTVRDTDALTFYVDFTLSIKLTALEIKLKLLDTGSRRVLAFVYDKQSSQTLSAFTKGSYRFVAELAGNSLPAGLLSPIIQLKGTEWFKAHIPSAAIRVVRDDLQREIKEIPWVSQPTVYPGFTYLSNTQPFSELTAGSLCVDCGANVGDVTQLMIMRGCRVIALEPNPEAFAYLSSRFEGVEGVTCISKGVLDRNAEVELYMSNRDDSNPLQASVSSSIYADKNNIRDSKSVTVKLLDIVELIDEIAEPISLMKVDIEGAEYKVLNRLLETGRIGQIERVLVEEHYLKIPSLAAERESLMRKIEMQKILNVSLDWM